jgi:hypothetical protein
MAVFMVIESIKTKRRFALDSDDIPLSPRGERGLMHTKDHPCQLVRVTRRQGWCESCGAAWLAETETAQATGIPPCPNCHPDEPGNPWRYYVTKLGAVRFQPL